MNVTTEEDSVKEEVSTPTANPDTLDTDEVTKEKVSKPMQNNDTAWWISTILLFLLGSFGALFAGKEFADPAFSDWLWPGSGSFLVGDSGRVQQLSDAIEILLVGVSSINRMEGVVLALGSLGILLSPFKSNLAQFLTCALVPLEAWYYMVHIVFMPLTGAWEAGIVALALGTSLQVLSFWRLQRLLPKAPASSKLLLNVYLVYGIIAMAMATAMIYRAPEFEDEMIFLAHVRGYFWKENGMTWSKGNDIPDGFDKKIEEMMAEAGVEMSH